MSGLVYMVVPFALAIGSTTQPGTNAREISYTTGEEQLIIERLITKPATQPAGAYENSLDESLAVLETRAWPPPNRERLVRAAIRALFTEFKRQTGNELASGALKASEDAAIRTGRFGPALSALDKTAAGRKLDRPALVQAGLTEMLKATGWAEACVLSKEQAAQLEAMMSARSQPAESGPAASSPVRANRPKPGILRLAIPSFEGANIAAAVEHEIKSAGAGIHALILDLRDNPGGRPEEANAVADLFLDERVLEVVAFRSGQRVAFKSRPGALGVRVIVLVNRNTGSGAEMLAMALQDNNRATLVGEWTAGALFGKDGQKLVGGQTILFRTEPIVLSPKRRDYSIRGVPPDVVVRDNRRGGRDAILDRAIQLAEGPDQAITGSRPAGRKERP